MKQVAVLASGEGSNLQALIDRVHGREGIEIVAVASDQARTRRRSNEPRGGHRRSPRFRSAARGPGRRDRAMAEWLAEQGAELVVLAGYMQLLSTDFLRTLSPSA